LNEFFLLNSVFSSEPLGWDMKMLICSFYNLANLENAVFKYFFILRFKKEKP